MPASESSSGMNDPIAKLRHDVRTPVNQVLGYAELLLEDADSDDHVEIRQELQQAIEGAHGALSDIKDTLPPTRTEISSADTAALFESLRGHRRQIIDAVDRAQRFAGGFGKQMVQDDLERIRKAAEQLVSPNAPSSGTTAVAGREHSGQELSKEAAESEAQILVVDDVKLNREVLRRRLAHEGYLAECAENGKQALEMIEQRSYDLILLDVMMPEIDGFEVLDRLKRDSRTRDIPVIMISALEDISSVVRGIELGAEDYLPKPFNPTLLRARVATCLEKKRLRDQEVEYIKQVERVTEAASAVEDGTYQPGAVGSAAERADALGQLARVFDGMAIEVRAREERLRDRVRSLRQEIETAQSAEISVDGPTVDGGNLQVGEHFADRYEIVAALGAGAMGSVYRARDVELDDDIAIKTLLPELVTDHELVERFKQEVKLARRISHPNVVRTHDFGQWAGVHYLTMELVEGITVRNLIVSRNRLGISATMAIASQLADALIVAHDQGVVHRDIKPQNLLLDSDGVLKVMDFGVARLAERTITRTEAGLAVGTPAYMPPEQLLGEAVDSRSDLYAVGAVLYECLTGTTPLQAATLISLVAKVFHEKPRPLDELNDEVPPVLSALILDLLAKEPDDRIQSAYELATRLANLQ